MQLPVLCSHNSTGVIRDSKQLFVIVTAVNYMATGGNDDVFFLYNFFVNSFKKHWNSFDKIQIKPLLKYVNYQTNKSNHRLGIVGVIDRNRHTKKKIHSQSNIEPCSF